MIIFKLRITSSLFIALAVLILLSRNTEAKGGGRGGGRGRGRGGMHHGGGGSSSYSEETTRSPYGNTFGSKGLPKDSYIYKDFYKYSDSSGYLISSLFHGAKIYNKDPTEAKKYYESISSENFYRKWDNEQDREWRKTTRAPYFDNKLPGDLNFFPASAVVGAAKAFGLVTLLPLNVPPGKPLMYCDNTDLIQSKIRINNENTYVCNKTKIEIECRNGFDHECVNKEVQCDKQNGNENIYCSHGTLLSKTNMFCDIKYKYFNDTVTTVNCHEGKLPKGLTSFIPTTSTTTEFSYYKTTTTPKPLSFSANVHIFLLNLMGKSDVLETTTQESFPYPDSYAWYPEALTIPPETTTTRRTTTRDPSYVWMKRIPSFDSTEEYRLVPLPKEDAEIADIMTHLPNSWVKVPISKVFETTTHQP